MKGFFLWGLIAAALTTFGQQIIIPSHFNGSVLEDDELKFRVVLADSSRARFSISGAQGTKIQFDSIGNFYWKPGFDVVSRLEKEKEFALLLEAQLPSGSRTAKPLNIKVQHRNRPPVADALPIFYVKQSGGNTYQISPEFVYDPDDDPIIIKPYQNQLPEGVQLSSTGIITWSPSKNQFNSLKNNVLHVEFVVQDQPDKVEARGKVRLAQTQLDLPPELLLVPGDSAFTIKEDELINIKFYASDPNGDDNLTAGGFVTSDNRIAQANFKENSKQQAEFTWQPGYKFVDDAEKSRKVELTFFTIDKSNNRVQRKVRVTVLDAENLDEKDKLLYQKYRNSLIAAKNLIDQLDENHDLLTKMYKQAKKGKKNRAIINASLGATTGLSPLLLEPNESKVVSGIGGTTVLTLGTLEATEVLGKSKADILDKIKINVEIRNQLQVEGDNFAKKYALKSSRRQKEFDTDREKLLPIINNQKLVLLELDAAQRNKQPDNKGLKRTFPDFADEL